MGVALGGAVAGPSVIRDAVNIPKAFPPVHPYPSSEIGYSTADASPAGPPQSLIDEARRLARGDVSDEMLDARCGIPISDDVSELRSLSPAGRRFIAARHYREREKQKIIKRAKAAMEDYDKTGWLKHIW